MAETKDTMNTLILLSGIGIGCGLCTITAFVWLLSVGGKAKADNKGHMQVTEELLRERNAIDTKVEKHLGVLAEWAHQNRSK
jgi:hypothetical protein